MKKKVVVFGAGAIGRGLLADIASVNGYKTVFVEAVKTFAEKLRQCKTFKVNSVGQTEQEHTITGYDVLDSCDTKAICKQLADCEFAATAVGGANLGSIAEIIAFGLKERKTALNILVCENWPKADVVLKEALLNCEADEKSFRSVPCSVERMARGVQDCLNVIVESGQSVYVDSTVYSGNRPEIKELLFCDNIEAYYKRKLYTNNAGHVLLAYMGHLAGCEFLYEALEIPAIYKNLIELLQAASQILVRVYGIDVEDMQRHIAELVKWRFANRKLADTVERVAREPLRKLGAQERLVGLIGYLIKYNLPTMPVSRVIAAAMHYNVPQDSSSVKMGEIIAEKGPEAVLEQICGFEKNQQCFRECIKCYYEN